MNFSKFLFLLVLIFSLSKGFAQDAEEIIANYIENTGGVEAWSELKSTKMTATVSQDDKTIPVTIYSTEDGKQAVIFEILGRKFTQLAFDGVNLWHNTSGTNPQKYPEDLTYNMALNFNDFPSPLLHYKENGYKLEYEGIETKDYTETYKIRITQEPIFLNGVQSPRVSYYYFDIDNFVPRVIETIQMGQPVNLTMNDYQEVEGLYFPFILNQGGQTFQIKDIEINPVIDESIFAFPTE